DADGDAADGQDRVRPLEHDDARTGERAHEIAGTVRLPVVVAEHGDGRELEVAARVGDDADLVDLPVLREVAGEDDHVRLRGRAPERLAHPVAVTGAGVDVAGGRDADR